MACPVCENPGDGYCCSACEIEDLRAEIADSEGQVDLYKQRIQQLYASHEEKDAKLAAAEEASKQAIGVLWSLVNLFEHDDLTGMRKVTMQNAKLVIERHRAAIDDAGGE